jgi:hypothetical protein
MQPHCNQFLQARYMRHKLVQLSTEQQKLQKKMSNSMPQVGCMWAKANARTFKLMVQVSDHLAAHPGWDRFCTRTPPCPPPQIFNDYLMHPSHGEHRFSHAHLRVMDIDYWLNSKIFFKYGL